MKVLTQFLPSTFVLPKDSRTLLKTPKNTTIVPMSSGQYYHYGLNNVCKLIVINYSSLSIETSKIHLHVDIEGLPLSKSCQACLWPILCLDTITNEVY